MLATTVSAKVECVRAWKVPRRSFARPCVTQPFRFGKRRRTPGNVRRWAEQVDFRSLALAFTLRALRGRDTQKKSRLSPPIAPGNLAEFPAGTQKGRIMQIFKRCAGWKLYSFKLSGRKSPCEGCFYRHHFRGFPKTFLRRQWFRGFKRKRKRSSAWSFLPTAKIRLLLLPKSTRVKNPINSMQTEHTKTGAALWSYIFLSGVSKYDWWGSGKYVLLVHLLYMV